MPRKWKLLAVAASALLCVMTIVTWARSYWRSDALCYHGRQGQRSVQCIPGVLLVGWNNVGSLQRKLEVDSWNAEGMDLPRGPGAWSRVGFTYRRHVTPIAAMPAEILTSIPDPRPATIIARSFSLPIWPVAVATAVLPALWLRLTLRDRRRVKEGLCRTCGYDLRGTLERCPECGAVPAGIRATVA